MYTYYLRPVLVGHEATLTGGAAEEALRWGSQHTSSGMRQVLWPRHQLHNA